MKAAYTYTKNDVLTEALNEHFDAAAASKLYLGAEKPYYDGYAHVAQIVDEEIDSLEEKDEPEISFTKSEFNRNNFDLSSFRPQTELNPKIWINGKINSKVRLRLLDIADDFIDTLEVDWVKPKDIILTGSLANYNWSKFSDFDLHILMDYNEVDERTEFVKDYFNAKKKNWNDTHDNLKIYGFPIELYVQDTNERHTASGVYSLERDKWLVKPEPDSIKAIQLNKFFIKEKACKFMEKIDKLYVASKTTDSEYESEQIAKKAKELFDTIKRMRREALSHGNEMHSLNIVFKILRRFGYIEKLANIKTDTYDKIYSIK